MDCVRIEPGRYSGMQTSGARVILSGELGAYLKSLKTRKDSLRRAQDREVLPDPLP
jgi:hypothetical protein